MSETMEFPWGGVFIPIDEQYDEAMSDAIAERAERIIRYASAQLLLTAEPGKTWVRNEDGEWTDIETGETQLQSLARLYGELDDPATDERLDYLKHGKRQEGEKVLGTWFLFLEKELIDGFAGKPMPGETE